MFIHIHVSSLRVLVLYGRSSFVAFTVHKRKSASEKMQYRQQERTGLENLPGLSHIY